MTIAESNELKTAFARAVKTLLLNEGRAIVPGFGSFLVEHTVAHVSTVAEDVVVQTNSEDPVACRIHPPAQVVRFEPSSHAFEKLSISTIK